MSFALELLQRQNKELREQLEERDETIRQLQERANDKKPTLPSWIPHLTGTERQLLLALSDGRLRSKASIMNELYGLDPNPPNEKIIDVMIHKVRRKLRNTSIQIETVWGHGHKLTPESVAVLRGEAVG
ncbi:MAG: winged helix-turn-helix domain-containing protein [Dehalococcoidia bacterium]